MKSVIDGAQCGIRYVNESGGVLGRSLNLVVYDSKSTPEGAAEAVERAVRDTPAVLLGAGFSSYTITAARVAQAHGVPFISSVATNPNITLVGDYIFRVCFSDN
ncbi:MAG: ABC transporter substrate-binding protein, partial [Oceanidesulfovibrio sp.]